MATNPISNDKQAIQQSVETLLSAVKLTVNRLSLTGNASATNLLAPINETQRSIRALTEPTSCTRPKFSESVTSASDSPKNGI